MRIQFVSKGVDVSEPLRERTLDRIAQAVAKYFGRPGEGVVSLSRSGSGFRVDCSLHLPSGTLLQTSGVAAEAYAAADAAVDRLEKRLRRYKRRLSHRRGGGRTGGASEEEISAVTVFQGRPVVEDASEAADLEPSDDAEDDAVEPVVVAETNMPLPRLTPGDAVRDLELTEAPVLLFRNAAHGGLNAVYRRPDGHIGWIDPSGARDDV